MNNSKREDRVLPKASIIIPVYNGAKYLSKTLESARNQDLSDHEIIIIDDCSTDESYYIASRLAQSDSRVRLYRTETNLGSAARAINFVRGQVRGEYFAYMSQDDLVSKDWLRLMYSRAIRLNADAVIPKLVFYHEDEISPSRTIEGLMGDSTRIITGRDAFVYSLDWTIPGNALWKRSLMDRHGFFEFSMNSDEYTVRYYYLECKVVAWSGGTFFYRKDNPDAVTIKTSLRTFETPITDLMLWRLAEERGFSDDICNTLAKRALSKLIRFTAKTYSIRFWCARPVIERCYKRFMEEKLLCCAEKKKYKLFHGFEKAVLMSSLTLFGTGLAVAIVEWLRALRMHLATLFRMSLTSK